MEVCREIDPSSFNQYLDGDKSNVFDGDLNQDWTMEWWLKADAFPSSGNEVILYQADGTTGLADNVIDIRIKNDAGTLKLFVHIQENDTVAPPAADEHCDVEFDIDALVATATWEYLALTMDISAAVATKFELFHGDESTAPTSQGNGTVTSGTACTSIVSPIGDMWIFGDGTAGLTYDGRVFRWAVWEDIRTVTELADNYKIIFVNPVTEAGLVGLYWAGNPHDGDLTDQENNLQQAANTGAPSYPADVPTGVTFFYAGLDAQGHQNGPSQSTPGYRAGLAQPLYEAAAALGGPAAKITNGGYRGVPVNNNDGDLWLIGGSVASAGAGTTFPPLVTEHKSLFISTEPLEIALGPMISKITGQYILTDTVSVVVVKPDNTLYGSPPSLSFDVALHRWQGEIDPADFQDGEWLLYFTSDDPNALPQWLMLWWGGYVDDIAEIRQAALGRWRIVGSQLLLYEEDGTTVFRTFDLRDNLGDPTSTDIFDKDPVP